MTPTLNPLPIRTVRDARDEVAALEAAAAEVRKQVRSERRRGPFVRADLERAVSAAESRRRQLDVEVDQSKQLARRRKDEIGDWKVWYAQRTGGDSSSDLRTLEQEIAWRAAEIDAHEARIQAILPDQLAADGRLAQAQTCLAAFDAGAFDAPLAQDPRVMAVERAVEAARAQLRDRRALERRPTSRPTRRANTATARYEVSEASDGQFVVNLRSGNGRVILTSERYRRRASARNGIESMRANGADDRRFDRRESRAGQPYFVLTAANGQVIGQSQMYSSATAMERGVRSVKSNCRTEVVEG